MNDISVILSNSFIQNFNYCNSTGRRNTSLLRKPFAFLFNNSDMTNELEKIANSLTDKVNKIKNFSSETRKQNEEKYIQDIFTAIQTAIDHTFAVRKKYCSTTVDSSGPGHTISKYGESGWISTTTTRTPKGAGFMERELQKALLAMEKDVLHKVVYNTNKDVENLPISFLNKCVIKIKSALKHLTDDRPKVEVEKECYAA